MINIRILAKLPEYSDNFIVVDAMTTANKVLELLDSINAEYLVVSRSNYDGNQMYYVFPKKALIAAMRKINLDKKLPLKQFLNLHEGDRDSDDDIKYFDYESCKSRWQASPQDLHNDFVVIKNDSVIEGIIDFQKDNDLRTYLIKGTDYTHTEQKPTLDIVSKGKSFRGITRGITKDMGKTQPSDTPPKPTPTPPRPPSKNEIKRYPEATFPNQVQSDSTTPLELTVKVKPTLSDTTGIVLSTSPAETELLLNAILSVEPSGSFECVGDYYQNIIVPVKEKDSDPVLFQLNAKKIGHAIISVNLYHKGTFVGKVSLKTEIVDPKQNTSSLKSKSEASVSIPKNILTPDLELNIVEISKNPYKYKIILASAKNNIPRLDFELTLNSDPEKKFKELFSDIETFNEKYDLGDKGKTWVEENMTDKGKMLYDTLFSAELKSKFWPLRGNIDTVRVISDDPWIPWEIIRPYNGKVVDDFLCMRYSFSRWHPIEYASTKERLNSVLIALNPDYNEEGYLDNVKNEKKIIEDCGKKHGFKVDYAIGYEQLRAALKKGGFDVLHFCGHASYNAKEPGMSQIEIEEGLPFKPENLGGLADGPFGESGPIVILNACQAGMQGFSFTGIGGWSKAFLGAKASAFIGTLWSVSDDIAAAFTENLYEFLATGKKSIDQALKETREKIIDPGDPTRLAYTLYAQPNVKTKLGMK